MDDQMIISGIGVVSPLGLNKDEHLQNLWSGRHGFRKITAYDTTDASIVYAGEIEDLSKIALPNRKLQKLLNRKDLFGLAAAYAAINDAGLADNGNDPTRRGAFVGSCSTQIGDFIPYFETAPACISDGGLSFDSNKFGRDCLSDITPLAAVKVLLNGCLAHVSQQLNIQGPNTSIMDGHVSGLKALLLASQAIKRGDVDWALVGAMSAPLDPFQMGQAKERHLLAPQFGLAEETLKDVVRPFDTSAIGTILSEGAVFLVLEARDFHAQRKAPREPYARFVGVSEAMHHGTGPDLSLRKCVQKMAQGLEVRAHKQHIYLANNAGDQSGDDAEASRIKASLDVLPNTTAITNVVGATGCLREASGLFSLVHGMAMLSEQRAIQVINLREVSAAASGLPLLQESQPLAHSQILTANTNQFGQTVLAAVESM